MDLPPFFLLLLLSSSFLVPSNADQYFLNCGSGSITQTNDGRNFTGYAANPGLPGVNLVASEKSFSIRTVRATQSELYDTAMVFSAPAAYQFNIVENGTYILRLHFHASSSSLSSRFNVSASGYLLLPDFRPDLGSVVIKEFLLVVNSGEFVVYFVPDSSSAVAFVNAIELFLTPLRTFTGSPVVVSTGIDSNLVSRVLHPIHRINFGGQMVPVSNDRLWRTWLPDDPYLQSESTAKNGPIHISRPNYLGGNATDFDAPDAVYNTAKELNANSGHLDKFFNATWSFNVSSGSQYFVRVHICDTISAALGATVFNLYISSHFVWKVDPYMVAPYLAAPFYLDFLVESDGSGYMNVSVGPRNDTRITENAFINGLEIMEILSDSTVEPEEICSPGLSKQRIVAVVGLVACVIALAYQLATFLNPRKEAIKVKAAEAFSRWPLVNLDGGGNSECKLSQMSASDGYIKVPN